MSKPISPSEVPAKQRAALDPRVIEVWNDLITKKHDGRRATITQNEAVAALMTATGVERQDVFARRWLDIEDAYREQGWKVTYDKPGFNESYEAYFVFEAK